MLHYTRNHVNFFLDIKLFVICYIFAWVTQIKSVSFSYTGIKIEKKSKIILVWFSNFHGWTGVWNLLYCCNLSKGITSGDFFFRFSKPRMLNTAFFVLFGKVLTHGWNKYDDISKPNVHRRLTVHISTTVELAIILLNFREACITCVNYICAQ